MLKKAIGKAAAMAILAMLMVIPALWDASASVPAKMRITNVRGTQFTVSWVSKAEEVGQVRYGASIATHEAWLAADDDRGAGTADDVHHVTVRGLTPNTTTYFEVISGDTVDDHAGDFYSVNPGPALVPTGSCQPAGRVFKDAEKTEPAYDSIVYVTILGETGQGDSATESVVVTAATEGYWFLDLVNFRTADYSAFYAYTCGESGILVEAEGGADGTAELLTDAVDSQQATRPDMVLQPAEVNLKPYQPAGWDAPIVVSSQSGTTTDLTPTAGHTAYLDISIENTGEADPVPYTYALYLSGQLEPIYLNTTAEPKGGQSLTDVDMAYIFASPGSYTLTLVVDVNDDVKESDELDNVFTRLVTVMAPPPLVSGVSPSEGLTKGGTTVTITGENFQPGASVTIGGVPAMNVTFVSETQSTCTAPPHEAGLVDVVVTNPNGQSSEPFIGFKYVLGTKFTGRASIDIAGYDDLSVKNATVSLEGTPYTATTDSNGNFTFEEVPPGSYHLTLSAPSLPPLSLEIELEEGQSLELGNQKMTVWTLEDLNEAVLKERQKWDANGDGKIGLEEAIRALQIVSGFGSTEQITSMRSPLSRDPSPTVEASELKTLVDGNTRFALNLYQSLREETGNLFYSPYSISLALAMTYAGSRGTTEEQMANALCFILAPERLHPAFNALDLELAGRGQGAEGKDGEGFRLNIANALWGQKGYSFLPEFLDLLAENYGAGLSLLDFRNAPEKCAAIINQWVNEKTEGKIEDLIPPGAISPFTRLVLTNAIYFNAAWDLPFSEELTRDGPFTLLGGGQVMVPMMSQTGYFGYSEGEGYQAVELLYDGEELSMVIVLPSPGEFPEFESALTPELLNGVLGGLRTSNVRLSMPRFTYESKSVSLTGILSRMGMPVAFAAGDADFSGMDGTRNLFLMDVLHKAFVAVDEAGTEAAAATAVIVGITSAPPPPIEVSVNRPFIFLIRDRKTGAILFVGRVLNPMS